MSCKTPCLTEASACYKAQALDCFCHHKLAQDPWASSDAKHQPCRQQPPLHIRLHVVLLADVGDMLACFMMLSMMLITVDTSLNSIDIDKVVPHAFSKQNMCAHAYHRHLHVGLGVFPHV